MGAASNLQKRSQSGYPVFDQQEQESLQRNPHLRPYVAITKAQVAGFLCALGEYGIRVGENAPPPLGPTDDPRVNDAHHGLLSFYWRPERLQPISSADFVFNDEERRELGLHKYVRGSEHMVRAALIRLLEMLTVYSQSTTRVEQI